MTAIKRPVQYVMGYRITEFEKDSGKDSLC